VIEKIDALLAQARKDLAAATDEQQVEAARVKYLGKSGSLSALRKSMGGVPAADRPRMGKLVTDAIAQFEQLLEKARADLVAAALQRDLEWDRYNFEKLGFPPDHPARDMQDTFFLDPATQPPPPPGSPPTQGAQEQLLLRTHTSPVQVRAMLAQPPPIRVVCLGKVYRADSDITHTPMFHQVECLHVEEGISMAHLRGTLDAFAKAFFGPTVRTRLRPSYFPFTEPSAEVDISHPLCGGKGCKVCKYSGWLEVLGSGMVNPDVLAGVGYDPEKFTGYAFGVGIDRLAMLRHGIDDLRLLFENDARFLEQL
jgi:phenylalanyl-tRNA synthetase alpha chain